MWRMVRNPESDRSSGIIVETVAGNRAGITDKVLDPFNLIVTLPSFRPACCRQAGMTTRRERTGCYPDNPFAIPDKRLTAAPAVIPAKAGIQWFNNSFSRSGNDNRCDNRRRVSGKTCRPFTTAPLPSWIPAFAGMTTGVNHGAPSPLLFYGSALQRLRFPHKKMPAKRAFHKRSEGQDEMARNAGPDPGRRLPYTLGVGNLHIKMLLHALHIIPWREG